jgi:hypothetical protein
VAARSPELRSVGASELVGRGEAQIAEKRSDELMDRG